MAYYVIQGRRSPGDVSGTIMPVPSDLVNGITVYFFHTAVRCSPCRTMEALTKQTLNDNFSTQMKERTLQFRQVNIDNPRFGHLINRYSVFTSTVVLVRASNGIEHENRSLTEQVWQLYDSEKEYVSMLSDELFRFMSHDTHE